MYIQNYRHSHRSARGQVQGHGGLGRHWYGRGRTRLDLCEPPFVFSHTWARSWKVSPFSFTIGSGFPLRACRVSLDVGAPGRAGVLPLSHIRFCAVSFAGSRGARMALLGRAFRRNQILWARFMNPFLLDRGLGARVNELGHRSTHRLSLNGRNFEGDGIVFPCKPVLTTRTQAWARRGATFRVRLPGFYQPGMLDVSQRLLSRAAGFGSVGAVRPSWLLSSQRGRCHRFLASDKEVSGQLCVREALGVGMRYFPINAGHIPNRDVCRHRVG